MSADDESVTDPHALGANVAHARANVQLTQRELANAVGTDRSTIAAIENGRVGNPGVFTLYPIALALGVRFEVLMGVQPIERSTKAKVRKRATSD